MIGCVLRVEGVRELTAQECIRLRICYRCAKPLEGRRQRWCSDACVELWFHAHSWTQARRLALVRSSGLAAIEDPDAWAVYRYDQWRKSEWRCDDCGADRSTAGDRPPEVNHVDPRVGAGYDEGCWNHQTNLQVLCHPCHVAETTRQVRERRGIPEGGRPTGRAAREAESIPMWAAAGPGYARVPWASRGSVGGSVARAEPTPTGGHSAASYRQGVETKRLRGSLLEPGQKP